MRERNDRMRGVLCVLALTTTTLAAQAPAPTGWTQFRGNARLTGLAADALPATLTLRWTYNSGDEPIESSPAVGGDVVFVGDLGGTLHAVRAADGQRVWTFKTGGEIKSSPTVADTVV